MRGGVQSRSRRKGFSRLISRQYNQNRALLLQSFQADGLATRAKNVFLANNNNAIVWRPLVRKIPHERMGAQLGGFCVAYRLCRMRKNGQGDIWSLTASWTHSLRPVRSAMHEAEKRIKERVQYRCEFRRNGDCDEYPPLPPFSLLLSRSL